MITEERIQQLQEHIADLEKRINELQEENDILANQLADAEDAIEDLENHIAQLEETNVDSAENLRCQEDYAVILTQKEAERKAEREKMKNSMSIIRVNKKIAANQFCHEAYKGYILPETLEEIGRGVFNDCEYLVSLDIPASVKTIAGCFCKGCCRLKTVIFHGPCPENLIAAFSNCPSLEEIIVPAEEVEKYKIALPSLADKILKNG